MTEPAAAPRDLPASPADRRGRLFVFSGPSGVGKDSILIPLLDPATAPPHLVRCVTATTRAPREGEADGRDYLFMSEEEFEYRVDGGFFLEYARFSGRSYGTPREWVERQRAAGNDVILKIEVQGALQVRERAPDAILVFLAPPSWEELERRLRGRDPGQDPEDLRRRLKTARHEMELAPRYDYLVVNDRVPKAVDAVRSIIIAERCRIRK